MVKGKLVLMAALLIIVAGSAYGFQNVVLPAEFEAGEALKVAGEIIDVEGGCFVPIVIDWNNDGKKDLIAGQFQDGKIRLYLNTGEDSAPDFENFTYMKVGGRTISLSYM